MAWISTDGHTKAATNLDSSLIHTLQVSYTTASLIRVIGSEFVQNCPEMDCVWRVMCSVRKNSPATINKINTITTKKIDAQIGHLCRP
jgi:hypothetical protein